MKKLKVTLDKNNKDTNTIVELFAGYDEEMKLYNGDYTASWLLSDIHDAQWKIRTSKTIVVGKAGNERTYKYTRTIVWEKLLPNGTLLTDDCNQKLLNFIQKIFFLTCEDTTSGSRASAVCITTNASSLLQFISWVYLYDSIFEPTIYGFSKITQSTLEQFGKEFICSGSFGALNVARRIISQMGIDIESKDYLSLSFNEIEKVQQFLERENCYTKNLRGLRCIDRRRISSIFGIAKQEMYSHAATAFFRQFEPEYIAINDKVLLPINSSTQYPSHRTPLINDVKNKTYTDSLVTNVFDFLYKAMKFKRLFEEYLPCALSLKFNDLKSQIFRISKPTQRTPWIPLNTNLLLINKSIGMILNDADDILNYYEKMIYRFKRVGFFNRENNRRDGNHKGDLIVESLPEELKKYNITSFSKLEYSYKLGTGRSFVCVVELLVASCILIIAGLKPMRMEELINLKYDCLYFKKGDGYWLQQTLVKSGINDVLPQTEKPIPQIAARSIQCLQRINDIAKDLSDNAIKKESSYLFYQLLIGVNNNNASILSSNKIIQLLAQFCDYAGTSIDEFGRRWYVNIHELRKSFLLTFFWTFKESSLDACQWIAGHKDPAHVHAYIRSSTAGEEMTEIEAEYARQQMFLFHEKNSMLEMRNTEDLYNDICTHFKVKDVSSINEDELNEWIELCMFKGVYRIDVISLEEESGLFDGCSVAFKLCKGEANVE
ncbi:hypothetical protein VFES401_00645 [Aliivibrio fischeri]|uniref:hypothetical protein n=1 Tax=Aliivibrio fischeri TaxID=668 RepID=UPI00107EC373|nr:hypothetical protein [Aliivibrio fischeri]TGA73254.1 hypothetical protein VFES401_00645 [Aliivibrio fischeri]